MVAPRLVAFVWGGLALGLAFSTFVHNTHVWTSERALWQQAARVSPSHPRAWLNLAQADVSVGDLAAARQHFLHAEWASQTPRRSAYERTFGVNMARVGLAYCDLILNNNPASALDRLSAVLRDQPQFPLAHELRAQALMRLGDCHGAQADWTQLRVAGFSVGEFRCE